MRTLERAHPLCCFCFLLAALGLTIFTRSPVLLLLSAAGAAGLLMLSGMGRHTVWLPVIVAVSAVLNPIFSHRGDTVLFFVGDLAVTLESVAYGAVFGLMLAAAAGWSIAAAKYMTSDKYIWIFGRVLPLCGLVLSCGLRLVPLFIRRSREFSESSGGGGLKASLKAFSAATGYSAEQAMTTADSMRARGYGTAKRTSYSLYRFGRSEGAALAAVVLLFAAAVAMLCYGAAEFGCYPVLSGIGFAAHDIAAYAAAGALFLLPMAAVLRENFRRRRIAAQ